MKIKNQISILETLILAINFLSPNNLNKFWKLQFFHYQFFIFIMLGHFLIIFFFYISLILFA